MAKRIIWSKRAKQDRMDILAYWYNRNKSKAYPKKLNKLLKDAIEWISINEYPRRKTDFENTYIKSVRNYKIVFDEDHGTIRILTIWDSRQDPEKLKDILK